MSTGRFLGGLLIGGALGVIIGMLVAPRAGEETRDMIRDEFSDKVTKVNRSVENVKYRTAELRGKAMDVRDKAMDKADQMREKGLLLATELEEAGRDTWDKVRSTVKIGKGAEESPN